MTSPQKLNDFSNRYPKHWLDLPWQERNEMIIGLIEHELAIAHQFLRPVSQPNGGFDGFKPSTPYSRCRSAKGNNKENSNQKQNNDMYETLRREVLEYHRREMNQSRREEEIKEATDDNPNSPLKIQQQRCAKRCASECEDPLEDTDDEFTQETFPSCENLTRERIEHAPQVPIDEPVSREEKHKIKKHITSAQLQPQTPEPCHQVPMPNDDAAQRVPTPKKKSRNKKSKKLPIVVAPKPPPRLPAMQQRLCPVGTVNIGDTTLEHARSLFENTKREPGRRVALASVRLQPINSGYVQSSALPEKSRSLSTLSKLSWHSGANHEPGLTPVRLSHSNIEQRATAVRKGDRSHSALRRRAKTHFTQMHKADFR